MYIYIICISSINDIFMYESMKVYVYDVCLDIDIGIELPKIKGHIIMYIMYVHFKWSPCQK